MVSVQDRLRSHQIVDLLFVRLSLILARLIARVAVSRSFLWIVVLTTAGCTTMAKVTNLVDESCRTSFVQQLSRILTNQGESSANSDALANKAVVTLTTYDLGPRPFAVAAPSGTDYRFFIDRKGTDCVLTLYGRRKGFVSYTNNLTYIATESLPGCACVDS